MQTDYNLERFIDAQSFSYNQELIKIRNGCKTGHWIWYIFPQLKGFGYSYNSQYYGIENYEEAKLYANHPMYSKAITQYNALKY